MKILYKIILLLLITPAIYSQNNLPYLNASPGNEMQMVTGPDSSCFVFRGDRITRISKTLNVIWDKSYTGISFKNLLLSKTGSLFFLSNHQFGKINASDGNIVWAKSVNSFSSSVGSGSNTTGNITLQQLLLDRNNHLAISAVHSYTSPVNFLFFKTDTSGNSISEQIFTFSLQFATSLKLNLVNDSSGTYNFFISYAGGLSNSSAGFTFAFNSLSNTLSAPKSVYGYGGIPGPYLNRSYFYKSRKNHSDFYLVYSVVNPPSPAETIHIIKCNPKRKLKSISFPSSFMNEAKQFLEDEKENVSIWLVKDGPGGRDFEVITIDSSMQITNAFNFYHIAPAALNPSFNVKLLSFNNMSDYILAYGGPFLTNSPLTLLPLHTTPTCGQGLVYSNGTTCSITAACNFPQGFFSGTVYSATLTSASFSPTVLTYTNATVQNYCTILGVNETHVSPSFQLYPNPASETLLLKSNIPGQYTITLFNQLGEHIQSFDATTPDVSLNLQRLLPGVYFIDAKTDRYRYHLKFIKE